MKRRDKDLLPRLQTVMASLAILLLTVAVTVSAAEELSVEYTFDRPYLETVVLDGTAYDRVTLPGAPNSGEAGHPSLPATGARILIPYGSEVTDIQIIRSNDIVLADGAVIEPTGRPVKLSADPSEFVAPSEDPIVYAMDTPYPANDFESVGVQSFRGYRILYLKLQPVKYVPTTGKLYYSPSMTVVVTTINSGKRSTLLRGLESDEQALKSKVDNFDASQSYPMTGAKSRDAFDMVIITTAALAPSYAPLKYYHDTTGLATEIRTTTDIGSSNPDDIRAYISGLYLNDGIQYVIIGADDDIIPAKDLWVEAWSGGDVETAMPGDVFFGCLDGTYNYDGDGYAGEPNDGEGGGDVDLVAEVYVGRASAGNQAEVERFVEKTIWYLSDQHGSSENVLMIGEYLGFGGVSDYAAGMMNQNVDESNADGYTTVGIPSDLYNVDRLYDETWPGNDWPQSEIINRINAGQHILNHLGHGSPDYAMKMYNGDITGDLTNTDLCFLYSQTCLAGHLDGTDCFAETMNIKTDNGAFAVCMNARYGWGSNSSTDGPSQRFNREFWDAVFNPLEGKPEIGIASQDSKEDNLYRVNESCMRWVYYEQNLFGDPSVAIKGVDGIAFEYSAPLPGTVPPGDATTIEVTVVPVGGGIPVSGSGLVHYSVNGAAYVEAAMDEIFTNVYEATIPSLSCEDNMTYYFSAEEQSKGVFYDVDPSSPHPLFAATGVVSIVDDNFETDNGWTISGDATDGQWNRGTPVGGGERGDPPTDFDGSGQCFLTDNEEGNSDIDGGTTILTSPTFALTPGNTRVSYSRWFSNNFGDAPNEDVMRIFISNDGGATWVQADSAGPSLDAGGGWVEHNFSVSDFVEPTSTMRLKFEASDLINGSVVEAGLDALDVTTFECFGTDLYITTYALPEWTQGVAYAQQVTVANEVGAVTFSDKYNDLAGSGLSISATGLISGAPITSGALTFTVEATDEAPFTTERELTVQVNSAISIATITLPEWTVNRAYPNQQFSCTGGTGALVWTDQGGALTGTGLTLSTDGRLTGTPTATGPMSFTAVASDQVGGTGESAHTITINPMPSITTEAIPNGSDETPYSYQLESAGGTGVHTWFVTTGGLSGLGLSLSSAGVLSGNSPIEGVASFTARVIDDAGAVVDKPFSVEILGGCCVGSMVGNVDVSPDDQVTMSDLTVLIDHLFLSLEPVVCDEEANVDVSADGEITMGDLTVLIDHLFISLDPLSACP